LFSCASATPATNTIAVTGSKRIADMKRSGNHLLIRLPRQREQGSRAGWTAVVIGPSRSADMDALLKKLKVGKNKEEFLKSADFSKNTAQNFSSLVYSARNHIVHNQETEFHLTHTTLDVTSTLLLEDFLIPSLEEICFFLTIKPNSYVWYSHPAIKVHR
jgi:hypothetical protein